MNESILASVNAGVVASYAVSVMQTLASAPSLRIHDLGLKAITLPNVSFRSLMRSRLAQ